MVKIEISNIPDLLDHTPDCINVMLCGDTGIGKTTIIEKYCKDRDIYLKTLILSQLEASETLGIPVRVDREWNGKTIPVLETAIPEWALDLYNHKNSMLFLDEFLCAQPSVMNAFLNFLTQKQVHGIDLSHVRIVAATNIMNYTFDPDQNMIARFCWFYAINTKVNEYLNDTRIINNYKDESILEGVLFEPRSLKPRCQEWLKKVDDEWVILFYEGFTNRKYVLVHKDADINTVIAPYFKPVDTRHFAISDDMIPSMIQTLMQTFNRIRKWDKIISNFCNMDLLTLQKITDAIKDATNEK